MNNAVQAGGNVTLPFGGTGESGVGRVQGKQGYLNYVAPQSLMTSPDHAESLWMPYHEGVETMVTGLMRLLHGRSLLERLRGARDVILNRPPSRKQVLGR